MQNSIFILLCMPIILLGSDTNQEGLFDNGPLGLGFIQKDEQAIKREIILAQTRAANDLIYTNFENDHVVLSFNLGQYITQAIVFLESLFISDESIHSSAIRIAPLKTVKDIHTIKVVPSITNKNKHCYYKPFFGCNPVVVSVLAVPDSLVFHSGGTVCFRSRLHYLRQQFEQAHESNYSQKIYFRYDDQKNELFGTKEILIDDRHGIVVQYSDKQSVVINYNKEKDCYEYILHKR